MLYTSRPLERIYAAPEVFDRSRKRKPKEEDEYEYRDVLLPSGRIVTRRDGENFVIEKISSTDMKDYLNEEFMPGKNMKS